MMGELVRFDTAQQMLLDLSKAEETTEAGICAVIMVDQKGCIYTAVAVSEDRERCRPFAFVGGMELLKRRIQGEFLERLDEL